MKLWLIKQDINNGYDTYDSAVVVAENEEDARCIHPNEYYMFIDDKLYSKGLNNLPTPAPDWFADWVINPNQVKVTLLGEADSSLKAGEVICASFNAG